MNRSLLAILLWSSVWPVMVHAVETADIENISMQVIEESDASTANKTIKLLVLPPAAASTAVQRAQSPDDVGLSRANGVKRATEPVEKLLGLDRAEQAKQNAQAQKDQAQTHAEEVKSRGQDRAQQAIDNAGERRQQNLPNVERGRGPPNK